MEEMPRGTVGTQSQMSCIDLVNDATGLACMFVGLSIFICG